MKWGLYLVIFLYITSVVIASTSLHDLNGTNITFFAFDKSDAPLGNLSYGSNSYADYTPTTPNLYATICDPALTTNTFLDAVYYTESKNITASLIEYLPRIDSTFSSGNTTCATVDLDFATRYALYPGYFYLRIMNDSIGVENNATINLETFPLAFNGSFKQGLSVLYPPKRYLISTSQIFDNNLSLITESSNFLLTSILNNNGTIINETRLSPGQPITYRGSFEGGETIVVNGITALEIKVYDPCNTINESGFYVVNRSQLNLNRTCLIIENLSNTIINFAGELFDGDNFTNGSRANNTCSIQVTDSQNITFEQLKVQQFDKGICVDNSTVTVIGDSTTYNSIGAYVTNGGTLSVNDMSFFNNASEIILENNSKIIMLDAYFPTGAANETRLVGSARDVRLKSVNYLPPLPNITNVTDIDQYIEVIGVTGESYAELSFRYRRPLPDGITTDNVSIFEYNGTLGLLSANTQTNGTNATVPGWENGTWTMLSTLVNPAESLIIGPNVTNYSIFAPFGFTTEPETEPDPDPNPDPTPQPSAGNEAGGGGGSGAPSNSIEQEDIPIFPDAVVLELEIPELVEVMQGEAILIPFNVTNAGNVTANDVVVNPVAPDEQPPWSVSNVTVGSLGPTETYNGTFPLAPDERTSAQFYSVLVEATANGGVIVSKLMTVSVIPRDDLKRIKILEYPPVITLAPDSLLDVSFFVSNVGARELKDVFIQLETTPCLKGISGRNNIAVDETKVFDYTFYSAESGECSYNVLFYDDANALVGFAPMKIIVTEQTATQRAAKLSLLSLLSVWTAVTIYILMRNRREEE